MGIATEMGQGGQDDLEWGDDLLSILESGRGTGFMAQDQAFVNEPMESEFEDGPFLVGIDELTDGGAQGASLAIGELVEGWESHAG